MKKAKSKKTTSKHRLISIEELLENYKHNIPELRSLQQNLNHNVLLPWKPGAEGLVRRDGICISHSITASNTQMGMAKKDKRLKELGYILMDDQSL